MTDAPTTSTTDAGDGQGADTDTTVETKEKKTYTPEEQAAYIEQLKAENHSLRSRKSELTQEVTSTKTDAETKLAEYEERLKVMETEAFNAKTEAIRNRYNITDEQAKKFKLDKVTDLADYDELAQAITEVVKPGAAVVRSEGNSTTPALDSKAAFSRNLLANPNNS